MESKITKIGRAIDNIIDTAIIVIIIILLLFCFMWFWLELHVHNSGLEPLPDVSDIEILTVEEKYREAHKSNEEVVCWLQMYDTHIDYPVVQTTDNQFYVDHAVNGEYSKAGTVFLDYRNNGDIADEYNLLYGHHMAYDEMFSDVCKYVDSEYFNSHINGVLVTNSAEYELEAFAVIRASADDTAVFNPTIYNSFSDLYDVLKSDEVYTTGYSITDTRKILAMSTCETYINEDRIILYCWMNPVDNQSE